MAKPYIFLSDAQLKNELDKCLYCEEKPCQKACPADCSPADFIMAAKMMEKSDIERAANLIMSSNPLGGICGAVCPDRFCMEACSKKLFDNPINIPMTQAAIVQKAKALNVMPEFKKPKLNGKKIAIIGAGPAGLTAAAVLARLGYKTDIYEKEKKAGGMCRIIPESRLPQKVVKTEIDFIKKLGAINIKYGKKIKNPEGLFKKYDSVILTAGLKNQIKLNIPNEDLAVEGLKYLSNPKKYSIKGKNISVIGGGAVAADCAMTAARRGAAKVEIFTRKNIGAIQLPEKELSDLLKSGIDINGRTRIMEILDGRGKIEGIKTIKIDIKKQDIKGTEQIRNDVDFVILAIKNLTAFKEKNTKGIFFAGEAKNGPGSVVESVASGKNAAMEADAYIRQQKKIAIKDNLKSDLVLDGRNMLPISVETNFFGRKMKSPFIISASPHSDGYEQAKEAYKAGWAGIVMKTAFDNLPIHIPSEYMFAFDKSTYANCDNVSEHSLNRVCGEIKKLVKEYPDRLTMGSTGGPVTGNDETDKKVWQSNTLKLEKAGAMGIEYSLSCPQGGDGTKGDIVSQDAELSAKIIDWVMEISNPDVPKLFKLTGAVTSVYIIVGAIKKVYEKYPHKKAGITLANSFPSLGFRKSKKGVWDEGIVVGMSGAGIAPISNLTIAKASKLGVAISGNGGAMDYKAAANFLALGAKTVQFCTIAMKYGYGIIIELSWGLSHLMKEKGFSSVNELIGSALPNPITDFMDLSSIKKIPKVNDKLCLHCGNCVRCGYLAIKLNNDKLPEIDASKCVGCSLCVKKCFTGALSMRKRTKNETMFWNTNLLVHQMS
ncbi:MAG: FAD-dependent oxidoreductase [Elusimicrobia bacterium]|nr:FAD-dependent oxidoreductase [Elusimicrobiota bacterium]